MACVTKRRDRYVLDYYDLEGKRIRESLPAGTSLKKAKDKLREIEEQLSKGNYIPDKKVPFFKDVARDWLTQKKSNLRPSTWSVYEGHTKNHFSDFENFRIRQIDTAKIERFIADRQKEGMNISTLRKILVSMNQIFSYAVRHRYIDYNPVREAERPRGQGDEREHKIRILTPPEIVAFLAAVDSQKYQTLFKLAIMSGARQGELLGLKWHDVDWQNSQIHIRRTYNNQKWYDVKTNTSNRRIDLGPSMMSDLKRWKMACKPNASNLVFPNEIGKPIDHNKLLKRQFYPALKKAEIPKIRFHDLRHTYASLLIDQGENIKYIQSQLGHSSPTVTLNVYAHLMKPVNQEAAKRFEDTLFNGSGHKMVTNG